MQMYWTAHEQKLYNCSELHGNLLRAEHMIYHLEVYCCHRLPFRGLIQHLAAVPWGILLLEIVSIIIIHNYLPQLYYKFK